MISEYNLKDVQWWLMNLDPTIEHAIIELNHLRDVERQIQVAMEQIKGYVRDKMGLDELEPDPDILADPNDWQDD